VEILTWEEFITQKQRFDCPDCPKVKDNERATLCPICVTCYGDFRSWEKTHRDTMLLDELRAKLIRRGK